MAIEKFNPLPPGNYRLAADWTITHWSEWTVKGFDGHFTVDIPNKKITFPAGLTLTIEYGPSKRVKFHLYKKYNIGTPLVRPFTITFDLNSNKRDWLPVLEVP